MDQNKAFYEKNKIAETDWNVTFHELLKMDNQEFKRWVLGVRDYILQLWEEGGNPLAVGKEEEGIIEEFEKLQAWPIWKYLLHDSTGSPCIVNNDNTGTAVNQFFPGIMKTRIKHSSGNPTSPYDAFKNRDVDRLTREVKKALKCDKNYIFSKSVMNNGSWAPKNGKSKEPLRIPANNAYDWIKMFNREGKKTKGRAIWIDERNRYKNAEKYLTPTAEQLRRLYRDGELDHLAISNLSASTSAYVRGSTHAPILDKVFLIRVYKKDKQIFNYGLEAFRTGIVSQRATNFPSMTAKFVYWIIAEYLRQPTLTIYDPCAGWGGRLLGALALREVQTRYIGTDPNTNNFGRYEALIDFYRTRTQAASNPFWGHSNEAEIFREPAECIHEDADFQQYRGKVDLVFTSPPYFDKEQYSDDPTQSFKQYPTYESWRDGFLARTLQTCIEWLRPGGFLCWNIADTRVGKGRYHPLEEDTLRIVAKHGMHSWRQMKMILSRSSGGSVSARKNTCIIDGTRWAYEPIYVFRKPL